MNTLRLTRDQVREVDRIAIEEYGIPGVVLMENAALAVTQQAAAMLSDFELADDVLTLCGKGNNGGDGFAVARHLSVRGVPVTIALMADPDEIQGDARINYDIVCRMKLPMVDEAGLGQAFDIASGGLVIDAIYGTGFRPPAKLDLRSIAHRIRRNDCVALAVDIPSGMDCDTGAVIGEEVIPCERTVTFVAEKAGFAAAAARAITGDIIVGNIGVPTEIIKRAASPSGVKR